jgi:hypothetical protein
MTSYLGDDVISLILKLKAITSLKLPLLMQKTPKSAIKQDVLFPQVVWTGGTASRA